MLSLMLTLMYIFILLSTLVLKFITFYHQDEKRPGPDRGPDQGWGQRREERRSVYSSYNVMIVGHSLGAGLGAVLALLMRPMYPNLKCLGYGMPASVFDWRTAQG